MSLPGAPPELKDRLFVAGDDGYDRACRIFNAMIDRRPVAVVRCGTAGDVAAGLGYARDRGLEVSVRGGGHSAAGHALCEGVVLDLSPMNSVTVDPDARTARVQGGGVWADVDKATEPYGLATPGGRVSTTGVGGLTLGGGQGWLSSPHGLCCDNVLSMEVVTADGRLVRAGDDDHPDLFWALRGGGGNFGVVTEFTFRLHQIPVPLLGGLLLFPIDRAPAALHGWRDAAEGAADELATAAVVITAPAAPFVPEPLQGATVLAVVAAWFGDQNDADAAIAPLRALNPVVDVIAPMSYTALQSMLDDGNPSGIRSYWTAEYVRDLTNPVLDAFIGAAEGGSPAPLSQAIIFPLGNAANRVPVDQTAFGARDAKWILHSIALWPEAADDQANIDWARRTRDAVRPFSTGAGYLNVLGDQGRDRVRAAYGPNYDKLVAVKRVWDPDNVFRHTHNIPPGTT